MTYDPTFLTVDPRDDLAAYTVDRYNRAADPMAAPRGAARHEEITQALATGAEIRPYVDVVIDGAVHALLDPMTRGESVSYTRPAPSADVATRSTKRTKRTKKGASVTVGARGRVWTVGDSQAHDDQTTRTGRVPRSVISHAIDELRRGNRYGHVDGDALAALTTRLYDIPDLIGTDHWSWSQATVEIPSSGAAVLAAATCGITAGIAPAVDAATMPRGEWRHPRNMRTMPTRRRVTMPRKRAADPIPREHVVMGAPWRTWHHVIELPAGADRPDHMWHGHRLVTRGATVRTVRREATAPRESFVIDDGADIVDAVAALAAVVQDDGRARYGWRVADGSAIGTITVDKRSRLSVTGIGEPIRQCATVDALRKRLATV